MFKVIRNDLDLKKKGLLIGPLFILASIIAFNVGFIVGAYAVVHTVITVYGLAFDRDRISMLRALPVDMADAVGSLYADGLILWCFTFFTGLIIDHIRFFGGLMLLPVPLNLIYLPAMGGFDIALGVSSFLMTALGMAVMIPLGIGFIGGKRRVGAELVFALLLCLAAILVAWLSFFYAGALLELLPLCLFTCIAALGLLFASYKLSMRYYKKINW